MLENKKGFTLVEIIISISLIVIIGITTTVVLVKKTNDKKEKEIEKVTQVLQNASSIYLSINKDDNSSVIENIQKGGSGYVIPIETLLNEGYITEDHIKTLQDNGINLKIEEAYMLAAAFSDNKNLCTNSDAVITIEPSYKLEKQKSNYYLCDFTKPTKYLYYDLNGGYFNDYSVPFELKTEGTEVTIKDGSNVTKKDESSFSYTFDYWSENQDCTGNKIDSNTKFNLTENKVIYACYKKDIIQKELTLKEMMNSARFSNNIGKAAISEQACQENGINPEVGNDNVVCKENGLFLDRDKTNGITYYYFRGAVENNYVKFANKLWRILWINSNNEAKLIIDDAVDLTVKNLNNQNITLESDDSISDMYIADIRNRPNDYSLYDLSRKIPRDYYILQRNKTGQSINSLLSNCTTEGVDCTLSDGTNYRQNLTKTYQNLNKSDYLNLNTDCFNRNNIVDSSIYKTALNNFLKSITNDTIFNAVVPSNLNWYYYTTNYWDEKSIYYKKRGCNCNDSSSCCYNRNFPSSFEVDSNSYNSTQYISSKIGLINYHELRMAGLNETSIIDSDNFLIKDKNNSKSNFLIAERYKEHSREFDTENNGRKYGDYWYYVDGNTGNISNYQVMKYYDDKLSHILLRTYDQNKTLDSCSKTKTVSGKVICDGVDTSDGSLLLGGHANDHLYIYNTVANHIKPVVVIKMNEYSLSNNTGTASDPYTLIK